jgi:hypothetical protein
MLGCVRTVSMLRMRTSEMMDLYLSSSDWPLLGSERLKAKLVCRFTSDWWTWPVAPRPNDPSAAAQVMG